jgi:AcrR family transcriptional regulator
MLSTRTQILDSARRLFAQQGYLQTSIREIAEQLGMTKTAVLYHFPSKADIIAALAEPYLTDLTTAIRGATSRQELFEGFLDVYLRHRKLLRDNVIQDLALLAQAPTVQLLRDLMFEANHRALSPNPTFREKIRVAQAIAALSDPIIAYADDPADQLREEVLRGVALLLSDL